MAHAYGHFPSPHFSQMGKLRLTKKGEITCSMFTVELGFKPCPRPPLSQATLLDEALTPRWLGPTLTGN